MIVCKGLQTFTCLLLLSLLLGPGACGHPSQIDCTQIFTGAVCGADGNTYENDCFAEQAGVFNYLAGACPYAECNGPVCGNDGNTYLSKCFAELSGIGNYLSGSCPHSPCSGPVCGSDGNTYISDCFAWLSGITEFDPGACPP